MTEKEKRMKDLEKLWNEIEDYSKKTLGKYSEDFLSRTYLGGYSEYNGKISTTAADRAWNGLTAPSASADYAHINQLGYALNPQKSSGRIVVVPRRDITKVFDRDGSEHIITDDNKINFPKNDTEKNMKGVFPSKASWKKDGKVFNLPSAGNRMTDPIMNKIIRGTVLEAEAVDQNGNIKNTKTMVGSVDRRLKHFHKLYGPNIQSLFMAVTGKDPLENFKANAVEALNTYSGGQKPQHNTWLDPVDFKKNFARIIALTEKIPFVAVYMPASALDQEIYQAAVNRGLAYGENYYPVDWERPENMQIGVDKDGNGLWGNIKYREGINKAKRFAFEKNRSTAFAMNAIAAGIENGQVKIEDIREELEEARRDVEKAFEREIPEELEQTQNVTEFISPFASAAPSENVTIEAEFDNYKSANDNVVTDDEDDDDFPF